MAIKTHRMKLIDIVALEKLAINDTQKNTKKIFCTLSPILTQSGEVTEILLG